MSTREPKPKCNRYCQHPHPGGALDPPVPQVPTQRTTSGLAPASTTPAASEHAERHRALNSAAGILLAGLGLGAGLINQLPKSALTTVTGALAVAAGVCLLGVLPARSVRPGALLGPGMAAITRAKTRAYNLALLLLGLALAAGAAAIWWR